MTKESTWGWWAGRNDEFFDLGGPFKTREEAINTGEANDDGEGFHIVEACVVEYSFDADTVIEQMLENAETVYEDYAEIVGSKEEVAKAKAELQALLDGWAERNSGIFTPPTNFASMRNQEFVVGRVSKAGPLSSEEDAELEALNAEPDFSDMEAWNRRGFLAARKAHFAKASEA